MAPDTNPTPELPELHEVHEVLPPPPMPPPAPRRAYPQLWKFLWGGILVVIGTLLPFGPFLLDKMTRAPDVLKSEVLPDARPGSHTLAGAIFLVMGLLLIGQMWAAIRDKKVALGAVLIMIAPCLWTWVMLIGVCREMSWFSFGELARWSAFERLGTDLGTGFLLLWLGSTIVELTFLMSLVKVFTGGKSEPVPATARASSATRRR